MGQRFPGAVTRTEWGYVHVATKDVKKIENKKNQMDYTSGVKTNIEKKRLVLFSIIQWFSLAMAIDYEMQERVETRRKISDVNNK